MGCRSSRGDDGGMDGHGSYWVKIALRGEHGGVETPIFKAVWLPDSGELFCCRREMAGQVTVRVMKSPTECFDNVHQSIYLIG